MSSGLEVLGGYKTEIQDATAALFADAPKLLDVELSDDGAEALDRLEAYAQRPGKCLRGSVAALTYDMAAGTEHAPEGVQLGAVLELMQSYLLIIDDVMDRSPLRRGAPSLHMLYQEAGSDEHEAGMLAISVGLIAQHLGSLSLQQLAVPAEARLQVMGLMHRNMAITGFGQFDDVAHVNLSRPAKVDIVDTYRKKTSYYTFVNPLQLGFALAGKADAATLRDCEAYGLPA
ncbi:MAG: polyprenyl synthetase family protein, partial [Candidatus Saccharimonadales bacterium]